MPTHKGGDQQHQKSSSSLNNTHESLKPDQPGGNSIPNPHSTGILVARRRAIIIIAVIFVPGLLIYVYFASSEIEPSRLTRIPAMDSTPGGDRQRVSRQYQETVQRANDHNLVQAEQSGVSYIPIPETVTEQIHLPENLDLLPWTSDEINKAGETSDTILEITDTVNLNNDTNDKSEKAVQETAPVNSVSVEPTSNDYTDRLLAVLAGEPASEQQLNTKTNEDGLNNESNTLAYGSMITQLDTSWDQLGLVQSSKLDAAKQQQFHNAMISQMNTIANAMKIVPPASEILITEEIIEDSIIHPPQYETDNHYASLANLDQSEYDLEKSENNQTELQRAASVNAGSVLYGEVLHKTSSDNTLPVVAQITTGRLKGIKLIGQFSTTGNVRGLLIEFSRLIDRKGNEIPISAYAVDGYTGSAAIASKTDLRLLARYGPIMASAFISALARSASTPQSTIINSNGLQTVVMEQPEFQQSIYAGVSAAAEHVASDLIQYAPRGPRIIINAGHAIGILFIHSIHSVIS